MKIQINYSLSDKPLSIDLTEVPERPTPAEASEAITVIGERLGTPALAVVKVSGFWLLGTLNEKPGEGWRPLYGHRPGERTRSFDKLVREGLQVTVVRLVPIK